MNAGRTQEGGGTRPAIQSPAAGAYIFKSESGIPLVVMGTGFKKIGIGGGFFGGGARFKYEREYWCEYIYIYSGV